MAALAIAGLPPIKLKVEERIAIYQRGKSYGDEAKKFMMIAWEEQWQNYNGWAKYLSKISTPGLTGKWGNVNFYFFFSMKSNARRGAPE